MFDASERLKVQAAFHDRTETRGTTDTAKDRERRARSDAACAGDDDHGDCRANVARDQIK